MNLELAVRREAQRDANHLRVKTLASCLLSHDNFTIQYSRDHHPVRDLLNLPRAPIGKYWERKTRIPELLDTPIIRPLQLAQLPRRRCANRVQYFGLFQSTAIAHSGAIYDAKNHSYPYFTIRSPHPLSQCITHTYFKMPNGQTLILKDSAEKISSIVKLGDQKLKSQTNGENPASKVLNDGLGFEASAFERTDKKIRVMAQRILPDTPHLVSVPTKNPYGSTFPNENRNTPFEDWEVKHLQHMTLISNGSRGVAWVRGDWQDELGATSPYSAGRSGTATPQSERDPNKPRSKMSYKEYQDIKAGKKPQSSYQTVLKNPHQNVPIGQGSASVDPVSPTQKMIDEIIQNNAEKAPARSTENYINDIPRPRARSPPPKDILPIPEPLSKPQNQLQNGRAVWPPSNAPDWKKSQPGQQARPKRSHDASEPSHPQHPLNQQKRQKLELKQPPKKETTLQKPTNSATSNDTLQPKAAPGVVLSSKANQLLKLKISAGASARANQTKVSGGTSQSEQFSNEAQSSMKPAGPGSETIIPPLLSPLPQELMSPDEPAPPISGLASAVKLNHITLPSSKSKTVDAGPDEQGQDDIISPLESPLEIPHLMSPLPSWFEERIHHDEAELHRYDALLAANRANANPNTVGARHERSRQPDTPGVARKTAKSKTSNSAVAKDIAVESANSTFSKAGRKSDGVSDKLDPTELGRESRLVKLKYGKRNIKRITYLLQMPARPFAETKTVPVATGVTSVSESRKQVRLADDTEKASSKRSKVTGSDGPTSVPIGAEAKKHPRQDESIEEPAAKRSKASSNIDVQRARTPLTPSARSPAPNASTVQKNFSTPKKGDAMKSVAMRKVDSSEGRVLTPHGASVSTPASAEKQRTGGSDSKSAEVEALKAAHTKYVDIGLTLKRQVDQLLKIKQKDPPPIAEEDRRLGAVITMECCLAYMVGFHSYDASRQIERKPGGAENWVGFFGFLNFATSQAVKHQGELFTLALLLNAASREALERIYMDRLANEPANSVPTYLKELAKNARERQAAWSSYRQQCKEHPVDFAIAVEDVKIVGVAVLTDYCKKMGIAWEKKLEF